MEIIKTIQLPICPQQAFLMFILPDKLIRWLCEKAEIDAQEGGRFELWWDKNYAMHYNTVGCKIHKLDYGRLLVTEFKGPREFAFMNSIKPYTTLSIELNEQDNGSLLTLTHSGFGQGEHWDKAAAWFSKAWDGALQQLMLLCQGGGQRNMW